MPTHIRCYLPRRLCRAALSRLTAVSKEPLYGSEWDQHKKGTNRRASEHPGRALNLGKAHFVEGSKGSKGSGKGATRIGESPFKERYRVSGALASSIPT
jgi:hypothetical protein